MNTDLQKLRSLRKSSKSHVKAKQNDVLPPKQSMEKEKTGTEFYKRSLTLLDPKGIYERTKNLLQKNYGKLNMTKEELILLANQYMQNYGGCPFTGA